MNLSEWIRLLYGLTLGTSTPLIDVGARPLRPIKKQALDGQITAFIGGSGNCVAVGNSDNCLLINSNMGNAAEVIFKDLGRVAVLINQKAHAYFASGNELYTEARDIYVGSYPRARLVAVFSDRKVPNHIVSDKSEIAWGSQKIILEPVSEGMFEKNLVVYLPSVKTLMLGDMFNNNVYPIFKMHGRVDVMEWTSTLERILSKFQPDKIIPGEGEVATAADVGRFIEFLRDVSVPNARTSALSEKYNWEEIPGLSSLDASVEFFKRGNQKS